MKSKKLFEIIIKTFKSNGFVLLEPDVLLDSDYIIERSGEKFRNSMLTFESKDGKIMCLRPDLTVASSLNYLQKKNVTLSLPVIDTKKNSMIFKKWIPTDKLIQGPFGTMEPSKTQISILPQILVVPMLSFDRELYRLGYGGGYYDKSINILKKHFQNEKIFSIQPLIKRL
mgnify:CR=1 FL=1